MPSRQQLERDVRRTLALSFFRVFMVLMPVIVLFFESRGLTLAEVLLLQAWFGVLVLLIAGLGRHSATSCLGWRVALGGVAVSAVFFVCRGFGLVILRQALNKRVPSEFRATANSFASLGFRGAFALTAPVVGKALDLWDMATTFALLGAASLVVFALLILPLMWAAVRG